MHATISILLLFLFLIFQLGQYIIFSTRVFVYCIKPNEFSLIEAFFSVIKQCPVSLLNTNNLKLLGQVIC